MNKALWNETAADINVLNFFRCNILTLRQLENILFPEEFQTVSKEIRVAQLLLLNATTHPMIRYLLGRLYNSGKHFWKHTRQVLSRWIWLQNSKDDFWQGGGNMGENNANRSMIFSLPPGSQHPISPLCNQPSSSRISRLEPWTKKDIHQFPFFLISAENCTLFEGANKQDSTKRKGNIVKPKKTMIMKPTKHSLGIFHMKMLGPKTKKGKRKRVGKSIQRRKERTDVWISSLK